MFKRALKHARPILATLSSASISLSASNSTQHPDDSQKQRIIEATQLRIGKSIRISDEEITTFTTGFRGKKGAAIAVVEPTSLKELYDLITLYNELGVGYLLQGANTALKGQSTPNGEKRPVVVIRTHHLKKFKILDIPGNDEYKVILVQPGLALKDLEGTLSTLGYDLPHKIGSHPLGNTFGGSAATGCGGVRVDNRSGAPSTTHLGSLGAVTIGSQGIIYNGIVHPQRAPSGEQLFRMLDEDDIREEDIVYPELTETHRFIQSLFEARSYPITNHLHDNPFSGQGYEGTHAIAAMMYLVRKKPTTVATYVALLKNPGIKEALYRDVIFAKGKEHPDTLPILCESMNADLIHEIVSNGVNYPAAAFLALAPPRLAQYYVTLLEYRKRIIALLPTIYPHLESLVGSLLSRILTPANIRAIKFHEMLIVQVANRVSSPDNIEEFNARLDKFADEHPYAIEILKIKPGSLRERLILQIRNVAALATLAIAARDKGTLFAFDDAIMPGTMTEEYCMSLSRKLSEKFPGIKLQVYLYGHDLKQISHNDWVISFTDNKRRLTDTEIHEIYRIQHETMLEVKGVPHAEHGIGDHADTDLDEKNLIRLVAHRLLNDPLGLANPDGGFEKAFQKAIADKSILDKAIQYAQEALQRELRLGTLLTYEGHSEKKWLQSKLETNVASLQDKAKHDSVALAFGGPPLNHSTERKTSTSLSAA